MSQLNDLWVTYLQGLGYTGKNFNDLLQRALRFYGSSQRKNLNDLWKEYLTERGYSGSVPDMQYKWLGDKGYTGNLNDRFYQGLLDGNLFTTSFSPEDLFDGGQQGAWYDPSDLTTLFQDSAGTTPVTADGDPVGLMLDKHLGLELGPELVVNGTFDTDVNGWQKTDTYPTFTIASVNGHLRMEGGNPSGTSFGAKQDMAFQQGKTYQLSFDLISGPTNRYVRLLDVSGGIVRTLAVGSNIGIGTNNLIFTAQSNESGLSFEVFRDGVAEWDNISVRELPGNHATQDTTAAKPTYRTDGTLHWLKFDGIDDGMESPTVNTSGAGLLFAYAGLVDAGTSRSSYGPLDTEGSRNGYTLYNYVGNGTTRVRLNANANVFSEAVAGVPLVHSWRTDNDASLYSLRSNGAEKAGGAIGTSDNQINGSISVGRTFAANTAAPWSMYGLVVRGGKTDDSENGSIEVYLAEKSGVTLP